MISQWTAILAKGTAAARNGRAEATTTRLIALLRITACSAVNRNAPISSGNRNSAPPKPIRPPSAPMIAPPKAADVLCLAFPTSRISTGAVSRLLIIGSRYGTQAIAHDSRYGIITIAKVLNLRPGVRASASRERRQIIDGTRRRTVEDAVVAFEHFNTERRQACTAAASSARCGGHDRLSECSIDAVKQHPRPL